MNDVLEVLQIFPWADIVELTYGLSGRQTPPRKVIIQGIQNG